MESSRRSRRPSASVLVDTAVFALGLAVLAGALLAWRGAGSDPALLTALVIALPVGWVLTRFPLMVTGINSGILVPFAPVLLFFLLTAHHAEPATALLAWTLATLPAHLLDPREWTSRLFNGGSSVLAGLAATLVAVGLQPVDPVTPRQLLAVLAGAGTYYLLDAVLSAVSIAVEHRRRVSGELLQPGTLVGGALFLVVASLGYLSAAVDLSMPGWVTNLTVLPAAAVVVAARGWRTAQQRRAQQHELFQASVRMHTVTTDGELVAALEQHGSALLSRGRLRVLDRPPGTGEDGRPLPAGPRGAPRWLVAPASANRDAASFDTSVVEALALIAATAVHRVAQAEAAEAAALLDPLTGLGNRRAFTQRLAAAVAADAAVAVLFVDLDGFKAVNDTLGHAAGDELLVEVSRRLRGTVGAEAWPARLGGDEFAVLLPDRLPGVVEDTGDAVVTALREPFLLTAGPATIGASVGIAPAAPGDAAEALLARADAAMYAAKRAGGCRSVLAVDGV
ncbi:GGDEF domain-containing protein [Kineococcus radiotolerans]|uniref:Diguanylate cyclase n=1 Tax=Kineococcus radiotolerans (strain ATCC BAA-149 / DSM 14245 / SRS30216) TaxID=266940 RepID=A6WFE5_KINRD|nr:GGDEF domain-containing protein [Kineococcus radiotolerans]ABS05534.1 diguanylate cyclase [Kineococcus radiotolerans SRS30216 = ATCC BAA-149]